MTRPPPFDPSRPSLSASRYLALCDEADRKASPDRTEEERRADYAKAALAAKTDRPV